MSAVSVRKDDAALIQNVSEMLRTGASYEQVVAHMRALGRDKIGSIKILRTAAGIPLGEAKKVVHFSAAWADRRETDEALHESLWAAAEELGFVETAEGGERAASQ